MCRITRAAVAAAARYEPAERFRYCTVAVSPVGAVGRFEFAATYAPMSQSRVPPSRVLGVRVFPALVSLESARNAPEARLMRFAPLLVPMKLVPGTPSPTIPSEPLRLPTELESQPHEDCHAERVFALIEFQVQ